MSVTIFYFPLRARSESTKYMLEYASIPYTNEVYSFESFQSKKHTTEICHFGQLPSLKTIDGKIISQSGAMMRYVAKLGNLIPNDENLHIDQDMIVELSQDMNLVNPLVVYYQKDSDAFKEKKVEYLKNVNGWVSTK